MPRFGTSAAMARENIRAINTKALLDAIHKIGQVSRTELAGIVGLSQAAVTEITAALMGHGIIFEAREGVSTGVGRKPIMLQINYASANVLGVKVANHAITSVLTTLDTEVLATRTAPLQQHDPESVLTAIKDSVQQLSGDRPLVGAAVTLPGIVDSVTARVHSPLLGWADAPFSQLLQERLGLPVVLDNDVNALAAAEASFGAGREHESFLVVTLGRGVGLGMIINRQLYRGSFGGAGELGHVTLDPDGPACNCGRRGCVEAYLSDAALLRAITEVRPAIADLQQASAAAQGGDSRVQEVFDRAGDILGRCLAMLVNIFAPTLILLAGEGMRSAAQLMPAARESLARHSFAHLGELADLRVEAWGDDAWARGAAGLAAANYLEHVASDIGQTVRQRREPRPARGGD